MAFDETAKAIAMNGVSPSFACSLSLIRASLTEVRNALSSGCSGWKICKRT